MAQVGQVVFPGDILKNIKNNRNVTIIGPGLQRIEDEPNKLAITKPGILCFKPPNTYWVEGKQKRYIPKKGDLVVGVVTKRVGDSVRVDIGASELAVLSTLAFEGATKKTKPDIQIGDVVYGKLLSAHREMEPELVCVDSFFKGGKMGLLSNDGFIMNITPSLAQRLLNVNNPLLRTIGKKTPYEVAIGMNGKVWINAKEIKQFFVVISALQAAESLEDKTIVEHCRQYK